MSLAFTKTELNQVEQHSKNSGAFVWLKGNRKKNFFSEKTWWYR